MLHARHVLQLHMLLQKLLLPVPLLLAWIQFLPQPPAGWLQPAALPLLPVSKHHLAPCWMLHQAQAAAALPAEQLDALPLLALLLLLLLLLLPPRQSLCCQLP
jgi:hypothetical protein